MLRNPIRTLAVAAGAAALLGVVGATTSLADGVGVGGGGKPTRTPNMPSPEPFNPGEVCSFPVSITEVVNQTKTLTFPSGESRGSGRFVVRITNLETGTSVDRNISGPGANTYGPNGEWILTLTGSSIFWIDPDFGDATGEINHGIYIGHGPLRYVDLRLVKAPPTYENLCTTLS